MSKDNSCNNLLNCFHSAFRQGYFGERGEAAVIVRISHHIRENPSLQSLFQIDSAALPNTTTPIPEVLAKFKRAVDHEVSSDAIIAMDDLVTRIIEETNRRARAQAEELEKQWRRTLAILRGQRDKKKGKTR